MWTWFSGCGSPQDVRGRYRALAWEHHPDRGGSTQTMQQVNVEYHAILQSLHGSTYRGSDRQDHTYHYSRQRETDLTKKLREILAARLPGLTVRVIGTWIWVTGDTKPAKEPLKAMRLRWHSKRQAWYWRPPGKRYTYNSRVSLEDLEEAYGVRRF